MTLTPTAPPVTPPDRRVALILSRFFAPFVPPAEWLPVADAAARELGELLPRPVTQAGYLPEPLMQVLVGMAQGMSTADMALQLGVQPGAIKARTVVLYEELGVRTPAHAVAIAYQRGILGGPR